MNIYQRDFNQSPEIFALIKAHKNELAKKHLNEKPEEVRLKGWMNDTPLHIAAGAGNFELVEYLVESGAEVNAERSGVYVTPLCWASTAQIAEYLLNRGATMNERELYFATRQNRLEVIELLLKRGAKINASEPQYLVCDSVEAIQIYLNYGIKIDGRDSNHSNILHKIAWKDAPELFDFALENGAEWVKDEAKRTPYHLAKQGGRNRILEHLKTHYPHLIKPQIGFLDPRKFEYEGIIALKQSSLSVNWFFALTHNLKLILYVKYGKLLVVDTIIYIDVSMIRNFTFDKNKNIVIPTADNKLLIINQLTFEIIEIIDFEDDLIFDQIEYLPTKNLFIGSSSKWEIIVLDEEFRVLSKRIAENGTFFPKVNAAENLIAFWSYDQDTYFDLYELYSNNELGFIDTFFKDRKNTSLDFAFNNQEFAVVFPHDLEYYKFENGNIIKVWQLDISMYSVEKNQSSLVFINENCLVLGKGNQILYIDIASKSIIQRQKLSATTHIRQLYLDVSKKHLIVSTSKSLKLITLRV